MVGLSRQESLVNLGIGFLLIWALILQNGLLLTLSLLLGLSVAVSQLWGRYALHRIEYTRRFSRPRCFAGEQVELTVELTNRKVLPISYLTVDDVVPDELKIAARKLSFLRLGKGSLRLIFRMGWYQKVIRHYQVLATRRGMFKVGPAQISGGDPLGYITNVHELQETETLLVYPRLLPLDQVGIPSRRPFGDVRSRDRLFEDPMRFAGVRDYQPGDPINRVHWKASAVAGKWQVRVLDPSASTGLSIFLNTWSYETPWMGVDSVSFEAGCVVAASIVNWAVEQELAAGLYANGLTEGWGRSLRLPASRGSEVLTHALEGLARLQPVSNSPMSEMLADETARLSYGTTVVVISRQVPDDLAGALLDVRRSGRPVTLIVTGGESIEVPHLKGIQVYRVPTEEALVPSALA